VARDDGCLTPLQYIWMAKQSRPRSKLVLSRGTRNFGVSGRIWQDLGCFEKCSSGWGGEALEWVITRKVCEI
jgi:hypothetical protein